MPTETPKNFAPLDRDGVFAIVRDQLVDILETDPENISEGQSFKDDLNADSLALVELVDARLFLYACGISALLPLLQ